jgi:hypothetical protein
MDKSTIVQRSQTSNRNLRFPLRVEDGWPPFPVESLPFEQNNDQYTLLTPTLFVKNLSVGDIICIEEAELDFVHKWHHVQKSARTTIWLLRLKETATIELVLSALRSLGCNTTSIPDHGCYAVDVPNELPIQKVDQELTKLNPADVAIAFPAMRHPE